MRSDQWMNGASSQSNLDVTSPGTQLLVWLLQVRPFSMKISVSNITQMDTPNSKKEFSKPTPQIRAGSYSAAVDH